ncbi:fumarylacetoacetate hydrolase family protein [Fredinandcohnia sp. QZ13]|uniref:fumarylacetoacetate hydrolase family protein n=1 Tax=Fredinandcohnia sp. QZ13 TaxID=3073144 RepID=UPI0028534DA4|nr:fumarylacetoacetate hydrolase family protein [Fredinandcohnia sp. QZ13]MDR4887487.1 fumarylacetoacetate hydrolase family protein [Fredinandcohnia sp. QZ13]
MKLLTIKNEDKWVLGVQEEVGIVDIGRALSLHPKEGVPTTIMEVIHGGSKVLDILSYYLKELPLQKNSPFLESPQHIEWGPAVTQPSKIICVGLNYKRHADETNSSYPEVPILFNKFNNTLTGHNCSIQIPKVTHKLDYEVELGIVIGKKAKYVSREEALEYVFGYCTVNDLSARDLQTRTQQWLLGKSCDDFSPIGPYLVTADEVGNPNNLAIKTKVNGELRQNSNTSDMIFYCDEIISYISQHMTLEPGDLILTGTPEGVVLGFPEDQQVYLQPGDIVTVEIEKVGALTNTFIEER